MSNIINIIIGGAGFIGSNLSRTLQSKGEKVFVLDDLSLGSKNNLTFLPDECLYICDATIYLDLLDAIKLIISTSNQSSYIKIWHLAANSDILSGVNDLSIDVNKTFNTTVNILRVMEATSLNHLCFASSSAIYGDHGDLAISEQFGNLNPRSAYGAMKLASEALISASREKFLKNVSIFRFPNVVGTPSTHGILHDFKKKLSINSRKLDVLGDGTQCKSYVHVDELVTAMIHIDMLPTDLSRMKIYNIGPKDSGITVARIAEIFIEVFGMESQICFGTTNRGWIGDIPKFRYDTSLLTSAGWTASLSSEDAVRKAIIEIVGH